MMTEEDLEDCEQRSIYCCPTCEYKEGCERAILAERKVIPLENTIVNLNNYDLYLPIIKDIWIYVDDDNFYSHYNYNPDTGESIDMENPNTWYPEAINNLTKLDQAEYVLDLKANLLNILCEKIEEKSFLLLEYVERTCKDCSNSKIGAFDEMYCDITGCTKTKNSTCDQSEKNVFMYGNVYGIDNKDISTKTTEEKLNKLIVKYRKNLSELYDELDNKKENDIFAKTELLECIISDLNQVVKDTTL